MMRALSLIIIYSKPVPMKISETGILLIKDFEKLRLKPYLDSIGKPTIGWGNTRYKNGRAVKITDRPISEAEAESLFRFWINQTEDDVNDLLTTELKQNQFDVLVSFAYNIGSDIDADNIAEGLGDSKMLKLINENPNDPLVIVEMLKWRKAGGKVSNGLIRRRTVEAWYYSTGELDLKKTKI